VPIILSLDFAGQGEVTNIIFAQETAWLCLFRSSVNFECQHPHNMRTMRNANAEFAKNIGHFCKIPFEYDRDCSFPVFISRFDRSARKQKLLFV